MRQRLAAWQQPIIVSLPQAVFLDISLRNDEVAGISQELDGRIHRTRKAEGLDASTKPDFPIRIYIAHRDDGSSASA